MPTSHHFLVTLKYMSLTDNWGTMPVSLFKRNILACARLHCLVISVSMSVETSFENRFKGSHNIFRLRWSVKRERRTTLKMSGWGIFNSYYSPYVDRPIQGNLRYSVHELGNHRARHQPWDTLAVYGGDSTRFGDYRRSDTRSSWNNQSIMSWMNAQPHPSGYEVMSNGMYRRIGQFGQGYRHL